MPGLALLTIKCLDCPGVTTHTRERVWTRLDIVEVILSSRAGPRCVGSSYPPVFASFLIVCLSSLSRQGSANTRRLHVPPSPCPQPLQDASVSSSDWSASSLGLASLSLRDLLWKAKTENSNNWKGPPRDNVTRKKVKPELINPELITNKSMRPFICILSLYLSAWLCKQKAMIHLPGWWPGGCCKCTSSDVLMWMLSPPFILISRHTLAAALILIMHPQVSDQSESRIVQIWPIGEQHSPALLMHLHAGTTRQI